MTDFKALRETLELALCHGLVEPEGFEVSFNFEQCRQILAALRLAECVPEVEKTLQIAEEQFAFYAGNHDAKADQARQNNAPLAAKDAENKAEVNRKMVKLCAATFFRLQSAKAPT